jgi:hypothetical protein
VLLGDWVLLDTSDDSYMRNALLFLSRKHPNKDEEEIIKEAVTLYIHLKNVYDHGGVITVTKDNGEVDRIELRDDNDKKEPIN